MRNAVLLLIGIVLLYVLTSLVLQAIYGPSYGFLAGEDCWLPDDHGGWVKHGQPTEPRPAVPSVQVPILVRYLSIFLPALLLILFIFSPLRKHLEKTETDAEESPPATGDQNGT